MRSQTALAIAFTAVFIVGALFIFVQQQNPDPLAAYRNANGGISIPGGAMTKELQQLLFPPKPPENYYTYQPTRSPYPTLLIEGVEHRASEFASSYKAPNQLDSQRAMVGVIASLFKPVASMVWDVWNFFTGTAAAADGVCGVGATDNCYWVGGTGNFSDGTHWSSLSGGAGGVVPLSTSPVIFDASSGAGTATQDNVTFTSGAVTMSASSVTIAGSSNTWKVGGSWTETVLHYTIGTSTVEFTATANVTTPGVAGTAYFYNMTVDSSVVVTTKTITGVGNTLNFPGSPLGSIANDGTPIRFDVCVGANCGSNEPVTPTAGLVSINQKVVYRINSASIHIAGGTYYALTVLGVSASYTVKLGGNLTTTGNSTIICAGSASTFSLVVCSAGTASHITLDTDSTANYSITVTDSNGLKLGNVSNDSFPGILQTYNSVVNITAFTTQSDPSSTVTSTSGGSWTVSGSWTDTIGVSPTWSFAAPIVFNSSTNQTVTFCGTGGTTACGGTLNPEFTGGLTFDSTATGSTSITYTFGNSLRYSGTLTVQQTGVSSGTTSLADSFNVIGGSLVVANKAVLTTNASTITVTDVTMTGGASGTITLTTGAWTVSGNWDTSGAGSVFTKGTSTVTMSGATKTVAINGTAGFYNLTVSGTVSQTNALDVSQTLATSGAGTLTTGGFNITGGAAVSLVGTGGLTATTSALTVGAVTVGSGTTLSFTSGSATASDNWDSSAGTFTRGTSTVTLSGSSKTVKQNGTAGFYNLTIAGSITMNSAIGVDNAATINSSKSLTLNSNSLTVGASGLSGILTVTGNLVGAATATGWTVTNGASDTFTVTAVTTWTADTQYKWSHTATGSNSIALSITAGANGMAFNVLKNGSAFTSGTSSSLKYTFTMLPSDPNMELDPVFTCGPTCYWIGGTGNFSSTTHWSASSGGSSCGCTPQATDAVTFDASSGAGTATQDNASFSSQSVTMTNSSVTVAGSSNTWIVGASSPFAGSWSDANNHFSPGTSTVKFSGSGTITTATGSTSSSQFYNLTSDAGNSLLIGNSMGVSNVFTVTVNGTANAGSGPTVFINSANSVPLSWASSRIWVSIYYNISAAYTVATNGTYGGNVTIGGTATGTLGGAFNDDGTNSSALGKLAVQDTATLNTSAVSSYAVNITSTTNGDITVATGGTFVANASTITLDHNWDSSAGTFTAGTSTVVFAASGNLTTGGNGVAVLHNMTINAGVTTTLVTSRSGADGVFTLNGSFVMNQIWDQTVTNQTDPFVFGGSASMSGTATMRFRGANGTVHIPGRTDWIIDRIQNTGSAATYLQTGSVTNTPTGGTGFIQFFAGGGQGNITWDTGGFSLTTSGFDNLSGTTAVWTVAAGASTVILNGATSLNWNYANVVITSTAGGSWTVAGSWTNTSTSASWSFAAPITFNATASKTMTFCGSSCGGGTEFTGNVTFDQGSAGIGISYTMATNALVMGSASLMTVTRAAGSGTVTLTTSGSNLGITTGTGGLTIATNGALTANASTITVNGNWDSSAGTFTFGTSTVVTGATGTLKTSLGARGTSRLYNLTIGSGVTTTILTNATGVANVLTINGTIAGVVGVYISSSVANPLVIGASGTFGTNDQFIVIYNSVSYNVPAIGGANGPNLGFEASVGGLTATVQGNITLAESTINADSTDVGMLIVDTNGFNLVSTSTSGSTFKVGRSGSATIGGALLLRGGTHEIRGDMIVNNGISYLDLGSSTLTTRVGWTNNSTSASWNAGTSNVSIVGSTSNGLFTSRNITPGNMPGNEFYNLTFAATNQASAQTYTLITRGLKVGNSLTVSDTNSTTTLTKTGQSVVFKSLSVASGGILKDGSISATGWTVTGGSGDTMTLASGSLTLWSTNAEWKWTHSATGASSITISITVTVTNGTGFDVKKNTAAFTNGAVAGGVVTFTMMPSDPDMDVSLITACGPTCYWVGGTGVFSGTTHWSDASGSGFCTCTPIGTDAVVWDANSGGGIATQDLAPFASGNVTIAGPTTVNGSANTWVVNGNWNSAASTFTAATSTVNLSGVSKTLTAGDAFYFLIVSGSYTLSASVTFVDLHVTGSFTVNGQVVQAIEFSIDSGSITLTAWTAYDSVTPDIEWTFNPSVAGATVTIAFSQLTPMERVTLYRDGTGPGNALASLTVDFSGNATFAVTGGWSSHSMFLLPTPSGGGGGGTPPPNTTATLTCQPLSGTTYQCTVKPATGQTIATVTWDWGDGRTTTTTSGTAVHTYAQPGTYQVTASIIYASGTTDTLSQPLVVAAGPSVLEYLVALIFIVSAAGAILARKHPKMFMASLTLITAAWMLFLFPITAFPIFLPRLLVQGVVLLGGIAAIVYGLFPEEAGQHKHKLFWVVWGALMVILFFLTR